MKQLIVNADDFGYSPGVNRGIIKAHVNGIVTSTSVMVDSVAAGEASQLSQYPDLSVGLHFVFGEGADVIAELERQLVAAEQIIDRPSSHVDIHKSSSRPEVRTELRDYLQAKNIPYRFDEKHTYISSYIATPANSDLSVDRLKSVLDEVQNGLNELMCHVGYADEYLMQHSSYNAPREEELRTICSPEIKSYIDERGITLINWNQV